MKVLSTQMRFTCKLAVIAVSLRAPALQAQPSPVQRGEQHLRSRLFIYDLHNGSSHLVYTADSIWEKQDGTAEPAKLAIPADYQCNNDIDPCFTVVTPSACSSFSGIVMERNTAFTSFKTFYAETSVLTHSRHSQPHNHPVSLGGMTNDKIRALISRWRQRVEAQEHSLEAVDRMEEASVDLPEPETSALLTQAHQNELERCIMELEQLFD